MHANRSAWLIVPLFLEAFLLVILELVWPK